MSDTTKLLRAIIDSSSNGVLRFRDVCIVQQEPVVCIFANKAAFRILGAKKSDLHGRTIHDVMLLITNEMKAADADEFHQKVASGLQTGQSFDLLVPRKLSGSEATIRLYFEWLGDDIAMAIIDTSRDRSA